MASIKPLKWRSCYPKGSIVRGKAAALRRVLKRHAAASQSNSPVAPEGAFEGYLASSLEQIYPAREAFTNSSQNALTTLVVCYSAGGALLFWLVTCDQPPLPGRVIVLGMLALAAFWLPLRLRTTWTRKAEASYDLYVSACVHAAIVQDALGVPISHYWMELVHDLHKEGQAPVLPTLASRQRSATRALGSLRDILHAWRSRGWNIYQYYEWVFMRLTVWIAAGAGLFILAVVLFSWLAPERIWPEKKSESENATLNFGGGGAARPIGVRVTIGSQPASRGYWIRFAFGPEYPLNDKGERIVHERFQGAVFDILDMRKRVIYTGSIPEAGDAYIRVDG